MSSYRYPNHESNEPSEPLLLTNCKIVNYNEIVNNDIFIEDGIIKKLGRQLTQRYPEARRVDMQGRMVFPGGIDVMTHITQGIRGDLTADDVFNATRMAIAGGTTTIIESVHCPKRTSILTKFEKQKSLFQADSCCDYGFHVSLSEFNADVEKDMKVMVNNHGVNSFQMFTGYYKDCMLEDDELFCAMLACRKLGALAMVQAESGRFIAKKENLLIEKGVKGPEGHLYSRPAEMEYEATGRAIVIADHACCPLLISPVNCDLAAERIERAQKEGKIVHGFCTVAALTLTSSRVLSSDWNEAAAHICSPPLRGKQSQDALVTYMAKGCLTMCASAHSSYRNDQREMGSDDFRLIPEGISGIHERMSCLWEKSVVTNHMDPCKFVSVTSTWPAKIFGLFPKKGIIAEGSDADLVVWNPNIAPVRRQFSSKSYCPGVEFNVYERVTISGGPSHIILHGKEVARSVADGRLELILTAGQGRFIPRPSFPPFLYTSIFSNEKKSRELPIEREISHRKRPSIKINNEREDKIHHAAGDDSHVNLSNSSMNEDNDFHSRPLTNSGTRNHLDSSFLLSGIQIDEDQPVRTSIRTLQPPGGRSNKLW